MDCITSDKVLQEASENKKEIDIKIKNVEEELRKNAILDFLYNRYMETATIDIKYHSADIPKIKKLAMGDWIDLYCAQETFIAYGEHKLIPLGISMKLPIGFEAHLLPRSSTYSKYGIIMANGMGIIDESYCGNDDEWKFSAISLSHEPHKILTALGDKYIEGSLIPKGERIAQFRIMPTMQCIMFNTVEVLDSPSRGGFGSTDKIK